MLRYLSADIIREANSFPRAKLKENCELRGTDINVQGQISEHIFAPNGDYCLYYPPNLLRNVRSFKNWGNIKQLLDEVEHDIMNNRKSYNFLACDWFKNVLFVTNSLAKLLSDSLLLDSLLLDSLLSDSLLSQSHSKITVL